VAALRGQVTVKDIEKLSRRRRRRSRAGRLVWRVGLVGLVAGGAYAAWRWWDRQANPDWLVEPPAATEVGDRTSLSSVNGSPAESGDTRLDPEVQAKQDEAESSSGSKSSGSKSSGPSASSEPSENGGGPGRRKK
jgi:cytoskeletal protein RodZ